MTEKSFLNLLIKDKQARTEGKTSNLFSVGAVILDEIHERSLLSDILMGMILVDTAKNFKLQIKFIFMSATINH